MRRSSLVLILGILVIVCLFNACADVKLKGLVVPPPKISIVVSNYCAWHGFNYKDSFSYNSSAYFLTDHWENDFDRDGLPDVWESDSTTQALFNISPRFSDTNGDGYSDFVVFKNGLLTASQNLLPATVVVNGQSQPCSQKTDSDGDGLTDCEEAFLNLQSKWPDTDFDGIPDGIEFRFGMNPRDPKDTTLSPAGDGFTNYQKIKAGMPITTFLDASNQTQMLNTDVQLDSVATANSPTGENCYVITVTNVPLTGVTNGNKIIIQTVEDNRTPQTGGTTPNGLDRELRTLTILAPNSLADKSKIIVVVPPNRTDASGAYIGMDGYVVGAPGGVPLVVQTGG